MADQAERLIILLREAEESRPRVGALRHRCNGGLAAFVFGSTILGSGSRESLRAAFVVRRVVVKERRDGQHEAWAHRAHLREKREGIAFTVRVMEELSMGVRIVGIKWNLVEI